MATNTAARQGAMTGTVLTVIVAISFSHFLNDLMQALLPAIYPMLKDDFGLTFQQVGWLTLTFQFTASLLQPVVGIVADKRPLPYSMAYGMHHLAGLVLLAVAHEFWLLVLAAASSARPAIFHPRRRVALVPALGGFAQSVFRWAATSGRRSVRSWRRSSCCPSASAASPGSRSWPLWPWWCCTAATGTAGTRCGSEQG